MGEVITVQNVSKHFGEVTALNDVSIEIESGEIFGLIGPNGAGKTTLVRIITGIVSPDSGSISVFGDRAGQFTRQRLGLLPQSFSPPGRLSTREIVEYYAGLYDDPLPVDQVLTDVGMESSGDQWFERLSGGQQRRVCVATALINDPDLLVLDEPTTGIDPAGRRQLWDILLELRTAGRTVVLTTHNMEEAARLSDRVGLLSHGTIIETGAPDALVDRFGSDGRLIVTLTSAESTPLESIHGHEVRYADNRIIIPGVTPHKISDILNALKKANISYARVAWEQPSLEDVLLALTEEGGITE